MSVSVKQNHTFYRYYIVEIERAGKSSQRTIGFTLPKHKKHTHALDHIHPQRNYTQHICTHQHKKSLWMYKRTCEKTFLLRISPLKAVYDIATTNILWLRKTTKLFSFLKAIMSWKFGPTNSLCLNCDMAHVLLLLCWLESSIKLVREASVRQTDLSQRNSQTRTCVHG